MIKVGKRFSWRARAMSFKYAFDGLKKFFGTEHNAWIHLAATVLVVILMITLPVTRTEAILLIAVMGFVWAAELFNTAIERTADLVTTETHPQIKYIKDIAAAAVLVAAVVSVITGFFIFIPKL